MINVDGVTKENIKEYNENCHKLLIINKWGFWICKIITLFNSTSQQPNIDKI